MKSTEVLALAALMLGTTAVPTASLAADKPSPAEVKQEALKQQQQNTPLATARISETQSICAGPVPSGWIKVNDSWNPTTCGNPTSIVYNVWLIERYDTKPVGSVMQACSGPAPSGWVVIGSNWNPTACGSPSSIVNNIMSIKRLS